MSASNEILASIENRLGQLKTEIEALTRARAALDGRRSEGPKTSEPNATPGSGSPRDVDDGAEGRVDAIPPETPAPIEAAATTAPASRRPARRSTRVKAGRAVKVVPAGKLELLVAETAGLSTSALAERANGDPRQVLTLLRELEAAGRIRRTGQRRATRWQAITDEERIQERAAELAGRRSSAA